MPNLDSIKNNITSIHSNDIKQLSIIFDDAKKIIVEAPAGCGKTKTMISKIAYLIASNKLETTKKILALTFSVNASYKIKKDVFQQLPSIIECDSSESMFLAEKIVVSNYHGFCRKILSKYGYLISNRAIDYNNIIAISDEIKVLKKYISNESICKEINDFSLKVKVNDLNYLQENYKKYNELVKYCLLSNGFITYNAILTLTYELFTEKIKVKEFYQRYYPVIFIDEFQDTNCLSWLIIKKLINDETNLVLMGDPLQRIYGFIGAIPNLMNVAEETFYMRKYVLKTNYRFKNNKDMLLLDKNIRLNAYKKMNEEIQENANPEIVITQNQEKEAEWIVNKVKSLYENENVAILTRSGINDNNTLKIKEHLENNNIEYFFALFTDEDPQYISFHEKCLNIFNKLFKLNEKLITIKSLNKFKDLIKKTYESPDNLEKSLIKLLEIFCDKLFLEYKNFSQEEKFRLMIETFENKALRQNMDKISEKVILATIHASKGLEFQNVIMSDIEMNSFPTYYICKDCNQNNKNSNCVNSYFSDNEASFIEELSVFYVGFTRAMNKVFFTLSKEKITNYGTKPTCGSCFLKLKGIGRENITNYK